MHLYAIEACLDSVARCLGVQFNVFFEFRNCKFTRNDYFSFTRMTERDGAGSNEIEATFLLENSRISSTSKGPKLEEDVRAIGVDGIRNLGAVKSVSGVGAGYGDKHKPISNQRPVQRSRYLARSYILLLEER